MSDLIVVARKGVKENYYNLDVIVDGVGARRNYTGRPDFVVTIHKSKLLSTIEGMVWQHYSDRVRITSAVGIYDSFIRCVFPYIEVRCGSILDNFMVSGCMWFDGNSHKTLLTVDNENLLRHIKTSVLKGE